MKYFLIALCLLISTAGFTSQKDVAVEWRFLPEKSKGVDILLLVDNSGSMQSMQKQIAKAAEKISSGLRNTDFRLALLTTEPSETSKKILDSRSSNVASDLSRAVTELGTNGSATEKHLGSLVTYISGEEYAHFKRNGTSLEIILVTDEDDNEPAMSVDNFKIFLNDSVKRYEISLVSPQTCSTNRPFTILSSIVGMQPTSSIDTCQEQSDYETSISALMRDIVKRGGAVDKPNLPFYAITLIGSVDLDTISVEYGNQVLVRGDSEQGWVFKPSSNQLIFGNKVELSTQPDGTELVIKYSYR